MGNLPSRHCPTIVAPDLVRGDSFSSFAIIRIRRSGESGEGIRHGQVSFDKSLTPAPAPLLAYSNQGHYRAKNALIFAIIQSRSKQRPFLRGDNRLTEKLTGNVSRFRSSG